MAARPGGHEGAPRLMMAGRAPAETSREPVGYVGDRHHVEINCTFKTKKADAVPEHPALLLWGANFEWV